MTTVYIVLFYHITKIGTRSYHCRFTQSRPNKEGHVAVKKNVLIRCFKWLSFQSDQYDHY